MPQLLVIVVYLVIMISVGLIDRRRAQTADGFFVLNRRGSTPLITGSLVATILGGSATVGMAGLGFTRGLTAAWWLLVGVIGLIILGIFLAQRVRKSGVYTLPGLIEKQYGTRVSMLTSLLIVIAWLGVIAGQILASGKILSALGMGSPTIWMVVFTAVFVSYTMTTGQYGDIKTDIIQAVLVLTGVLAGVIALLINTGGFSGLVSSLAPAKLRFPVSPGFGPLELLSYLLLIGLTYVVGPDMYSRLFSARDSRTARSAVFWTAAILIPVAFGITLIGMGASVLFPNISAEQAFPTVISSLFSPLAGSLVLAALVAATMSSADSTVLSASTILSVDIIKRFRPSLTERQLLLIARLGILVLGLCSLLLALALKGIISALMFAYTVYTAGVIIPVLAGFYRQKLHLTANGALAAIITGGTAAVLSKLLAIKYLDLGSLLLSLLALFAVSLIENAIRSGKAKGSITETSEGS